jgi:hypothetical protein
MPKSLAEWSMLLASCVLAVIDATFQTSDSEMLRSLNLGISHAVILLTGIAPTILAAPNRATPANQEHTVRDIYLSVRTDGVWGSGTESDPYDGGTARKFDAIMDALPRNAHVILEPNQVFLTNGRKWNDNSTGWRPKDGLYLQGNGATIRSNPNVRGWEVISNDVSGAPTPGVNGVTIDNLTVDANTQNLFSPGTGKAISCIALAGSNNTCRKVHVTNMYGDQPSGNECFALIFAAPPTGASNCWAVDCLADQPRGDWHAAIALFGFNPAHPLRQSGVVNCFAIGRFQSGLVNLANDYDIVVTGCYSYDSQGVHHDTGVVRGLIVKDNVFARIFGTGVGSQVSSADASDFVISRNYFEITNQVMHGHSYGVTTNARNTAITKNTFVADASGKGYSGWRAIYSTNAKGMVIADNTGDATMEYYVKGTKVSVRNNLDFNGAPLAGFANR